MFLVAKYLPKTVYITGFNGYNGKTVDVALYRDVNDNAPVAVGKGIIEKNQSASIALIDDAGAWMGNGDYLLGVTVNNSKNFIYTDGKSLDELGVTAKKQKGSYILEPPENLVKVHIVNAVSKIDFSQLQSLKRRFSPQGSGTPQSSTETSSPTPTEPTPPTPTAPSKVTHR
jgi:hypothetical protein